ncbi:probable serine/threonine-protein kinase MARK-A isoform X6 [Ictalurus furcatus]|nr:probable serine/threonine-protein kinase MARK-A isoform X3 [Ictalurus furcatus]XP_053489303.1 probable serine/threonine-protein kinase MARK-A isoform X4 [Ictalurus furcatus]XP_053489308.1 probable serine/threonine-protein kinase MARK-A isoform X6 [Ictalurus furcatus]
MLHISRLSLVRTLAVLVMKNSSEGFVPHPEEDHHSNWTGESDEKYVSEGQSLIFPGPLMSAKMQKEELMRFIQDKCQECLMHLDQPEQQKSYFFWSIMEYVCNRNGRVMIFEISPLLFKGYGLLRRKLGCVEKQEDWCIPLAVLLCSAAPKDELREAIIEMGDMFASRKWSYAAHICYVVAQLELGSHPRFTLIGCDRMPDSKSALREAIERTEVYEYVLSLTTGFGQPHFQDFKYVHACYLAEAGPCAQALDYCERVATTVLSFPHCIQNNVMEWGIWLSERLLQDEWKKEAEEPKWLIDLRQLLEDRAALSSSSDDQEQCSSESEEPVNLQFHPSDYDEFDSRYTMGEMLGTGGFSYVYAGVHKADGKPVAIKCMDRNPYDKFITIPGDTRRLPLEVALMEMVSKPPGCENVVKLLEWFETSTFYILVLERPVPCTDLYYYSKGQLPEPVARKLMWQVVQAAHHCCTHGVFHRDIKPENILINTNTLEVKLIDFGCGDLLTNEPYKSFSGTPVYSPPECILNRDYFGVPATVWSLGVVLFFLVNGQDPFISDKEIVEEDLQLHPDLSVGCCELIKWCLEKDPNHRPTLTQIQNHRWFKERLQDTVQEPVISDLTPAAVMEKQMFAAGVVGVAPAGLIECPKVHKWR